MNLKESFENLKGKRPKKDQLLILFLSGVLCMVIALPTDNEEREENDELSETVQMNPTNNSTQYIQYLEEKLEYILSQIEGAGEVEVMITLSSSAEQVIEKDLEISDEAVTESDSQGGERTTNQSSRSETTIYDGDENGSPYISKEISPKVEGVVVIADGGDNAIVVKNITESVQALFGIESHKIRIVKKGG